MQSEMHTSSLLGGLDQKEKPRLEKFRAALNKQASTRYVPAIGKHYVVRRLCIAPVSNCSQSYVVLQLYQINGEPWCFATVALELVL